MPNTKQRARADLTAIAADLTRWVENEKAEGAVRIEADPSNVARLADPPPPPGASAPKPTTGARPATPAVAPASTGEPNETRLKSIAERIAVCTRCPLHQTRTRTVPGQGNPAPELVFVGEGPGSDEDREGFAFIGRAGQLLTRMIVRMGLSRDEVFIANIVKCRPTQNLAGAKDRPPTDDEMRACIPYLEEQLDVLRPRVIVCLGNTALFGLLGLKGITRVRGTWHDYRGIPVMPTFHPSFLLRGGGDEKARYWEVWKDMLQVLERLGRPAPETRK